MLVIMLLRDRLLIYSGVVFAHYCSSPITRDVLVMSDTVKQLTEMLCLDILGSS